MKPGLLNLFSALSILLLVAISQSGAQTPQRDNRPRTASISGRLTVGGKPAANAMVIVMEVDPDPRHFSGDVSSHHALVKVRTDAAGRYQVAGLTEGAYQVRALSKSYAQANSPLQFDLFKSVTLNQGESRDNVDFVFVRGGAITGRVTDAEGRPFIAANLELLLLDEKGNPRERYDFNSRHMTPPDDRGIYRFYGLPAGRYILSAGGRYSGRRKYTSTFYPDAADRGQAKVIEVKEGEEITGIDIRLGVAERVYEVAGRVIDAETGQAVPMAGVVCARVDGKEAGHSRGMAADDQGRFKFERLPAGRYELWPTNRQEGDRSSGKITFEINGADVSGLEVKALQGSTLSGVVILEGADDPAVKTQMSQMVVFVSVRPKRGSVGDGMLFHHPGDGGVKVAGDGSFRATGLPAGLASFQMFGMQEDRFSIRRIERDGAEIRSAIEIRQGEWIAGIRIIVAQANGTVRGQVKIVGDALPEGWRLRVYAVPRRAEVINDGYPAFHYGGGSAEVDEKGRFVIDRLLDGEFELTLSATVRTGQEDRASGAASVTERVIVNSGAETRVTLTFDPARRRQEERR